MKDTTEAVIALEKLADSFEASASDNSLSVWDSWKFTDDLPSIQAALQDANKIPEEIKNAKPEETGPLLARIIAAGLKIAEASKKL